MMSGLHFWKDDPYLPLWARWQRFKTGAEMRRIMREDEKVMETIIRKNIRKETTGEPDKSTDTNGQSEGKL